jgi:hypothetical protein
LRSGSDEGAQGTKDFFGKNNSTEADLFCSADRNAAPVLQAVSLWAVQ